MSLWRYTPGCERPPLRFVVTGPHAFVPEVELTTRRAEWDRCRSEELRPPDPKNEPARVGRREPVAKQKHTVRKIMAPLEGFSKQYDEPSFSPASPDEFDVINVGAAAHVVESALARVVGHEAPADDFSCSARALITNGYPVVPITRPDPGVEGAGKKPMWANWQARRAACDDVAKYPGHGWGVLCGQGADPVYAVDADSLHPRVAARFAAWFRERYPSAPQRTGRAPKTLFAVRGVEAGWRKLSGRKFYDEAGNKTQLEILGVGNQFVALGIHPATMHPYTWAADYGHLDSFPPATLPEVTREQLAEMVEVFERICTEEGLQPTGAKQSTKTKAAAKGDDDRQFDRAITLNAATARTVVELDCALTVLDLVDYDLWVDVGLALASLKGTPYEDDARALWIKHSMRSAAYNDGDERKWDSPDFKATDATFAKVFFLVDIIDQRWRDQAQAAWDARGADDVIAKLCTMPKDRVLSTWAAMAVALPKAAASRVIDKVHDLTDCRVNILKAELADVRAAQARKEKDSVLKKRAAGRKLIEYRPDAKTEHASQVEQAMLDRAKPGELLVFGGLLAQLVTKPLPFTHAIDDAERDAPPVPQIAPFTLVDALGGTERSVLFYETTDKGPHAIGVPQQVVEVLVKKRCHVAPEVSGLLNHPVVLSGGSILSTPGLHDATRLFMAGADVPDLRAYSQGEARSALERLRGELLPDFEFASTLDQDVALAGLFTAIERRVLPQAPGLLVVAGTQASGKTTLVRLLHLVLTGHDLPVSTFALGDEAEVRKALLSLLMSSPALVCFDNVPDGLTLRSGVLAAAMTSPVFSDRILGHSQTAEVPTNTMFTATGNNLSLGADEATRWLIARLAPVNARPQERAFRHRDIPAWGRSMRSQVLRDVLGIVAGYAASGTRDDSLPGVRFEAWDRLVRRPLVWAGGSDMAEAFRRNETVSEELAAHRGLLELLHLIFGGNEFRAGHVVEALSDGGAFAPFEAVDRRCEAFRALSIDERQSVVIALREALENLRVGDVRNSRKVGHALKAKQDASVVVGDSQLTLRGKDNKGSLLYAVVAKPFGGFGGF